MNKTIAAILGSTLLLAGHEALARGEGFYDTARVVDAEPIFETVEIASPEKHCWTEPAPVYEDRSDGRRNRQIAAVSGAVVGGVVGNQFGRGHGKDAMTVAGAVLGSVIGKDWAEQYDRGVVYTVGEPVRHCEHRTRVEQVEQLVGYRVTYRYRGETFTTRTDSDPGERIKVWVGVRPAKSVYREDHHGGRGREARTWDF